jgi:hypothetical protein
MERAEGMAATVPYRKIRRIEDVKVFPFLPPPFRPGPFKTKSGGELVVDYAFPPEIGIAVLGRFANYDPVEAARIPRAMISDRQYGVIKLPKGNKADKTIFGGTEFHRIREEIVMCVGGKVLWTCEDAFGEKREDILLPGIAVWMPPFVLHTYQSLARGSRLRVRCNTLLYPDDPGTSDTYSEEIFRKLQANCA